MPFTPFTKQSDAGAPSAPSGTPPAFGKKSSRKRRKGGKVAPAQKHLMQGSSRSLAAGGRR